MKSLEQQLADIEDAEKRLRPLIADARDMVQALKETMREARELFAQGADEALKGEMGKVIQREMADIVPDIVKFKGQLRQELNEKTKEVIELLDRVTTRYAEVAEQYDQIEAKLEQRGYLAERDRIEVPIPGSRLKGRRR